MLPVQEIGSTLHVGCGAEDRTLVVLQDGEPVRDIRSMILSRRQGQFEVGAQEGRAQLGDKFFLGVALVAPFLAPEFTGKARGMFGPVHDSQVLPELLHGQETRVWGDAAYSGQQDMLRQHAPCAKSFIQAKALGISR